MARQPRPSAMPGRPTLYCVLVVSPVGRNENGCSEWESPEFRSVSWNDLIGSLGCLVPTKPWMLGGQAPTGLRVNLVQVFLDRLRDNRMSGIF